MEHIQMAICIYCETQQSRPCSYTGRTREFYRAMIHALKYVARRCGYALAVHGTLKTDIDLLAVPWRESAASAGYLAEQIRKTIEQIIGTARMRVADQPTPTKKPCGRLAWSFYLQPEGVEGPYVDLSVMPASAQAASTKIISDEKGTHQPCGIIEEGDWRDTIEVGWRKERTEYWLRWTSPDGIYYWWHCSKCHWITEPEQIDMPCFTSKQAAIDAKKFVTKPVKTVTGYQ